LTDAIGPKADDHDRVAWPPAPYATGDRVRCVAATADRAGGLEAGGLRGTVRDAVYDDEGPGREGRDILVVWDGPPGRRRWHHAEAAIARGATCLPASPSPYDAQAIPSARREYSALPADTRGVPPIRRGPPFLWPNITDRPG
jgi:hypothetical protein